MTNSPQQITLKDSVLVNPSRFDADTWEHLIETGYEMSLDPEEEMIPQMDGQLVDTT